MQRSRKTPGKFSLSDESVIDYKIKIFNGTAPKIKRRFSFPAPLPHSVGCQMQASDNKSLKSVLKNHCQQARG